MLDFEKIQSEKSFRKILFPKLYLLEIYKFPGYLVYALFKMNTKSSSDEIFKFASQARGHKLIGTGVSSLTQPHFKSYFRNYIQFLKAHKLTKQSVIIKRKK